MAYATVLCLLKHLKELEYEDISDNIYSLWKDLLVFDAFLKEAKRNNDEKVQQIRGVVYEMEDIIDTCANKMVAQKSGFPLPQWLKSQVDLHEISQKVQMVSRSIGIIDHYRSYIHEVPPPREKVEMGFTDEANDIVNLLLTKSDSFEVISLVGMPGTGKTTLAFKIFDDPAIIYNFPIRIWVYVSQEFSDRDIFLSIFKEFSNITEDISSKENHEIAHLVKSQLDRGSFLIVMDDVWEPDHWRRLNVVVPINSKGKVLITSRNLDVGWHASRQNCIRTLRLLKSDESWELLRLVALHSLNCPRELEGVGQMIAANCGGTPLEIVIVGGILAEKYNSNTTLMEKEWKKVSAELSYLNINDPPERTRGLISLSFDKLPCHLRTCFLYLGMFPEHYEIPVSKLIRLWIGEGFVQKEDSFSLEKTAEKYLNVLINRNLLKIEKFRLDGKVKTCRIHDYFRDFCHSEAANEDLFKEIKFVGGEFTPPVSDIKGYRRLAVQSKCLEFISSKPSCPRARSFVSFSKDKFVVSQQNSAKIFAAFKFLKVLDVERFIFKKIDNYIYQLNSMKYLVLSSSMPNLPSKFSLLWNIQTIVFYTTSHTLKVEADIWRMKKLRYFKTNASAILPKPNKSNEYQNELHTLGTISVESCTHELLDLARNLKKLGLRGDLRLLLDGKIASFDSFGKSDSINKLKLIHDVYPCPPRDMPLRGLPQPYRFPSRLTSLTLVSTFLSWDAMSILGKLEKLKVLKLKREAFMGEIWKAVEGGFRNLQFLLIEETDLITWNASSFHYPRLRSLVLRSCEKLLAVPIGLADIPTLQKLELHTCKSAVESAKEIREAKVRDYRSYLKLSIFPYE